MIEDILDKLKKAHPSVSEDLTFEYATTPYKHIVIKNFLKEEVYNKMCNKVEELIAPTAAAQKYATGEVYNARIASLSFKEMNDGYDFFGSPEWKKCVSNLFNIAFDKLVNISLHYHKAPSKPGWVHADFSICSYNDDPEKDIIIGSNGAIYSDDTANRQPASTKALRRVACLYYFNNKTDISPFDGGGTAIYDATGGRVVKTIPPVNNSIFLFEISPTSYHTYTGAKFDRTALVHWFHSSISQYLHEKRDEIDIKKVKFDRWLPAEMVYNYKREKDYGKYFTDTKTV